jgi:ABC-type Zn uptake system ZnuABC Zn-binding protein ZnuA
MRVVVVPAAVTLLLFACGTAPQKSGGRVRVVATIGVLADWAREVGGDRVEAASLLTGSESPHTYEARPQDAEKLARADILFRVGLGLEEWLDPVVQNAGNARLVVVQAAAGTDGIIAGDAEHKTGNPHIWLDPELAKTGIDNLVNALVRADPQGENLYRGREQAYFRRLDSLSAAIRAEVAGLPDRRFVSFHDAWPYFARRFGFEIAANVEPIPGQEPSARQIARLVDLIRRERIKAIASEPQLPSALPDMLARETGLRVVVMNPLGGGLDSGTDYVNMLGAIADSLAAALR